MKVRLAALITACAATFLWYAEPLKSEDLAGICVSSKKPRSEVINACSNLIAAGDMTAEYRHLFLTKRALAYKSEHRLVEAKQDTDLALELQPRNYKTWILRAQLHEADGEHELAIADYDRAVDIAPETSFTHWKRARYLDQQGRDEVAFQGYLRVLELDPDADHAAEKIIGIYLDERDHEKALTAATSAAERWPEKAWVHGKLARVHVVHTKNAPQALSSLARMQEISPNTKVDILSRALVHLQIGDESEGIRLVDVFLRNAQSQRVSELDFLKRLARHIWTKENQTLESEHRGRAFIYEFMGRRDLARTEYHSLFEKTGLNGENVMERILFKNGLSTDVAANSSGSNRLDLLLDRYMDHDHDKLEWLSQSK